MQYHLSIEHELDDLDVMMLCRPTKQPDSNSKNETENPGGQSLGVSTFSNTVRNIEKLQSKSNLVINHDMSRFFRLLV